MKNFFSLFKTAPKNKREKDEKDPEAKPAIEHSVSSSSKTSTVPAPPATPVNQQVANKFLENAKNTNMESGVFSVVHGHDFNDPAMAAMFSAADIPITSSPQPSTEILKGAEHTNARFANFSIVGGNRYGAPQTHFNTNSATSSAKYEAELEPSLLR